jgi:hypothetical protein
VACSIVAITCPGNPFIIITLVAGLKISYLEFTLSLGKVYMIDGLNQILRVQVPNPTASRPAEEISALVLSVKRWM